MLRLRRRRIRQGFAIRRIHQKAKGIRETEAKGCLLLLHGSFGAKKVQQVFLFCINYHCARCSVWEDVDIQFGIRGMFCLVVSREEQRAHAKYTPTNKDGGGYGFEFTRAWVIEESRYHTQRQS